MDISRRNFKAIERVEMQATLQLWPWGEIHDIEDVEKAHKFIVRGITVALDVVAPYKTIRVRRGDNLYLSSETLDFMEIRDRATGKEYRCLRNKVSSRVKRDAEVQWLRGNGTHLVRLAQLNIAILLLLRQRRQNHQGDCSNEKYRSARAGRHPSLGPQEGSRGLGVAHRPPDQQVARLRHCPRQFQECMRDPHPQGQGEEHRRTSLLPPCIYPPRPL
jgi:hypothetical protein